MKDLVEELRTAYCDLITGKPIDSEWLAPLLAQAADEIERLTRDCSDRNWKVR